MINAKEAYNLAMKDVLTTEWYKENMDNFLSSVSNEIEKSAKEGFLTTTYEITGIHRFFGCYGNYFDTLRLIVTKRLMELGYEVEYYENPCGHWLEIRWHKQA